MQRWQALAQLAEAQHGVVARAQLLELGWAPSGVARLLTDRGWTRVHPGVYRLPAVPPSFAQHVMAAQLAVPVASVATAATAAHLHGLRPAPPVVDLLVGEHDRITPIEGIRLKRTRTLAPRDQRTLQCLRVASPARMLLDYAGLAQPSEVRALLIDSCQRRLVRLPDVAQRLDEVGPVRGRGVLRRLVWELDAQRCDSVLEQRVRRLLKAAHITMPAPHPVPVRVPGRTLHLDIAWPTHQVGIEVDGYAYHSSRAQLDRDHRRGNLLALAGWRVLRVGWDRVERDQDAFVHEVRALLGKDWEDSSHMRA